MDKTWLVYRHTMPDGKMYIGITSNVEARWNNGMGYKDQRKFFTEIVSVGWNNIKHEVLHDGLSEQQAKHVLNKNS